MQNLFNANQLWGYLSSITADLNHSFNLLIAIGFNLLNSWNILGCFIIYCISLRPPLEANNKVYWLPGRTPSKKVHLHPYFPFSPPGFWVLGFKTSIYFLSVPTVLIHSLGYNIYIYMKFCFSFCTLANNIVLSRFLVPSIHPTNTIVHPLSNRFFVTRGWLLGSNELRIPYRDEAKIAKICYLWTLWPVIKLILGLAKAKITTWDKALWAQTISYP